jgi:hypothetical protein
MTEADLVRALGQVEGKLDGVLTAMATLSDNIDRRLSAQDKRITQHDTDISGLTRKVYYVFGVGAAGVWLLSKIDITKLFAVGTAAAHTIGL